jgi:hypothetical protein
MTINPDAPRNDASTRRKKPYTKPEIRQVALRAEEAVLGVCKATTASTGPGSSVKCNVVGNCQGMGS